MTKITNFDELKRLHDRTRIAKPGGREWIQFAVTMMDSFPAIYESAKATNATIAELRERLASPVLTGVRVKRFLVCSTGEDVCFADPPHSLDAAIEMRDERQAYDDEETWSIVAEIDA